MPSRKARRRAVKQTEHEKYQPAVSNVLLVASDGGGHGVAAVEKAQIIKSPSQQSISTDAGASSSGCSNLNPSDSSQSITPEAEAQLPERVCAPNAPIWVNNGSKGVSAAWLLVLPKLPPGDDGSVSSNASGQVPSSPADAVLLGPYVITKNTFLHESGVEEVLEKRQRRRTQSLGAYRSCCF